MCGHSRGRAAARFWNSEISNRFDQPCLVRLMLKFHGQFFFSQHHWRTVSMVIRRHEIYGKSRRSVSPKLPSASHSTLEQTLDIAACHKHRNCWIKFGVYWWSSSSCQAGLPACHRTAEVLRGERHIRRCESSSLPAAIHAANLMIHHRRSPPTGTLHFPFRLWLTSLKHLHIKSSPNQTTLIAPVFYLFLC